MVALRLARECARATTEEQNKRRFTSVKRVSVSSWGGNCIVFTTSQAKNKRQRDTTDATEARLEQRKGLVVSLGNLGTVYDGQKVLADLPERDREKWQDGCVIWKLVRWYV